MGQELEGVAPGARLRAQPRLHRTYSMALAPQLVAALTIGAGHVELALHLNSQGARVTVLDRLEAALELAAATINDSDVRFVAAEASDIGRHVPASSQDAIFITDVVERIPSADLRWVFAGCRAALRPGGVCCVLTTERYCRPGLRAAIAAQGGGNLLETASLRALLAESFEAVDAFTWNGAERFDGPGKCDDLFAAAHAGDPYRAASLRAVGSRATGAGTTGWITVTLATEVSLPARFLLRARLHVQTAPPDGVIHLLFKTADRARFFWHAIRPRALATNPAELMLASETLSCVGDAAWGEVQTIVMRIQSKTGGPCDVRISDLRVLADDPARAG